MTSKNYRLKNFINLEKKKMNKHKLFTFTVMHGVEGLSETKRHKYIAKTESEALRLFEAEHGKKEGLFTATILEKLESELPILTDKEVTRAGMIFPNEENPVLEYQTMLAINGK